jgi:site-specific recombinase XerD
MIKSPLAIFDDLKYIDNTNMQLVGTEYEQDYLKARTFLKFYIGSQGTFNSYRREIEKFLQWIWHIARKIIKDIRREDIESFMNFTLDPLPGWVGVNKVTRFISENGLRIPNPCWRPFVTTISKLSHRKGMQPNIKNFQLSSESLKESFAILSSFYNYLLQEEYVLMNPVSLIRQKSKFIRKKQSQPKVRRLSELQWQYIIRTTMQMAAENPLLHERSLFILSALYAMYLRISELAANSRWMPTMNHFYRDSEQNWWFITVGKGNKERQIAVSDSMLQTLKRWRKYLGLTALPSPADTSPLLPKIKGKGPISSTTYIREIVQLCFDKAMQALHNDGFTEEAESLIEATVHWLRHTGISDDVKHRPREHVRDDAGHSSSATTDKYINIELKERHKSAKSKLIIDED